MNTRQIAAQLVQMPDHQQRAYLRTLNAGQLQNLRSATIQLRARLGTDGLGALGFKFGNLLKNIGGALIPFTALIPGVGPIVAAVGTAAFSTLSTTTSPQQFAPPPPPQTSQQPAAGGFTLSPAVLIAGVALVVLMKR